MAVMTKAELKAILRELIAREDDPEYNDSVGDVRDGIVEALNRDDRDEKVAAGTTAGA